jgi:hypothetical protein
MDRGFPVVCDPGDDLFSMSYAFSKADTLATPVRGDIFELGTKFFDRIVCRVQLCPSLAFHNAIHQRLGNHVGFNANG